MVGLQFQTQRNRPAGTAGRVAATLFLALFLVAGLVATGFMVKLLFDVAKRYTWTAVPCVILESGITEPQDDSPYQVTVQYEYEWKGRRYSSQQFGSKQTFSDYGQARRFAERFRPETKTSCYFNPANPGEAVIDRGNFWAAPFLLIPLLFVVFGGGGMYFVWRGGAKKPVSMTPISKGAQRMSSPKFAVGFFLIFFVVGVVGSYFVLVRPAVRVLDARDWPAVPCTVISSRVKTHRGDDSTTYSVHILYSYEVGGQMHKASRYSFVGGSSSGYESKAAVVRANPPGRKRICYVNPNDPTDAVLERGFTAVMWFGVIPLAFAAGGAGGIYANLRKLRRSTETNEHPRSGIPPDVGDGAPRLLKPQYSPAVKLVGAILVMLFWNGIVSVFLFQVVDMWRQEHSGGMKYFLTVFLLPFVAVGIGMIWFAGRCFLGLFSPRPVLSTTSKNIRLGNRLELQWRFTGRTDKIQDLQLVLEGREEATYRRGTDTCTDKEVFFKQALCHVTTPSGIPAGVVAVDIPASTMHSFSAPNNKIIWSIRLTAKVDWGVDLNEEFPITIAPLAIHERIEHSHT